MAKWNDIPEHPLVKEGIFSEKCLVQLHSDECYTGYYNARDNEWLYSSYGFMAKDEEVRRWILLSDLTLDKAATGKDYYGGNACYEAMRSVLTPEELRGFCVGSAFKYIWRHHNKGGREDLEKAADYLDRALKLDAPNADQDAPNADQGEPNADQNEWTLAGMGSGKHGVWIKRCIGYACPFCGAQAYEPADTCYKCGASLDEPDNRRDRPVNVGKTGVWIEMAEDYYGCPFCWKLVKVGDDHPKTLTCPRCLAVLSFEEKEQDD